jgi:hypothetical protein
MNTPNEPGLAELWIAPPGNPSPAAEAPQPQRDDIIDPFETPENPQEVHTTIPPQTTLELLEAMRELGEAGGHPIFPKREAPTTPDFKGKKFDDFGAPIRSEDLTTVTETTSTAASNVLDNK